MVQLATLQPEPVVELPKAPGRLLLGHTDQAIINRTIIRAFERMIAVDRTADIEDATGLPQTQILVSGPGIIHQLPLMCRPQSFFSITSFNTRFCRVRSATIRLNWASSYSISLSRFSSEISITAYFRCHW